MDTQATTTTQDKQVTIDVPENRLAEFYAFYGRFLAVGSGRRGRGGHRHGGDDRRARHAEHRCGHREQAGETQAATAGAQAAGGGPAASTPGSEAAA